jgi:hypothetical protein
MYIYVAGNEVISPNYFKNLKFLYIYVPRPAGWILRILLCKKETLALNGASLLLNYGAQAERDTYVCTYIPEDIPVWSVMGS